MKNIDTDILDFSIRLINLLLLFFPCDGVFNAIVGFCAFKLQI